MDLIDKLLVSRIYYILAIITMIFLYYDILHNYTGFPSLIGCSILLLCEIILLWGKKKWLNSIKYILISCLCIAVALILQYGYGVQASLLLWPLIWALGVMRQKYNRLSYILALITTVAVLFMSYIYQSPFNTLINLAGMYLAIRSIRIRQDAYFTSQLHLSELNKAHVKLKEAHEELQEASVHSMRYAALEERTRLAREIHDGIGHQLTSLIIQLQALEIMLETDPEKASESVSQLLQISRSAMAEVRIAVKEWSDDELGLGLISLKGLVSQTQARSTIQFRFYQDSEITEWSTETSVLLYRVLQESLTNILRHSNAMSAEVHIKETDNYITLSVSDDGKHTEDMPLTPGFGINGIIERCSIHGGNCTITAQHPHGLHLEVILPLEATINGA